MLSATAWKLDHTVCQIVSWMFTLGIVKLTGMFLSEMLFAVVFVVFDK